MQRISLTLFLLYCGFISLLAQDIDLSKYKEQYRLNIKKSGSAVKIDGSLDDAAWQHAAEAKDFWLKFPRDDSKANHKTEVKVTYDQNFLYIGAYIYDSLPYIGQSLKRDSRIRESDGLGVILDPVNNKTNGFYFSVSAYNVQADDLITSFTAGELNFSWDNKWYSATQRHTDHYTIEMAIPFKTLRYDDQNLQWGINFIRSDRKANEFHTWTRVPVNFPAVDIGYLGALQWDAPPPKPGTNISFIPYATGSLKEDQENNEKLSGDMSAGFDAKVALTSSLNLDLTVNPDFSQVEVDRQVTNITRFSIFFPERRNFFLENSDLFDQYGIPPIRPFYSRRIGLDPEGNRIPIIAGLRLTGNIASRTRIGVMNMQTKATDDYAAQNYSAVSVQQQFGARSSVKGYFFNRSGISNAKHPVTDKFEKYGRNAGGEISLSNSEGTWNGWLGYHHSMKENIYKDNSYLNIGAGYFGRKITTFVNFDNVGENYHTEMGFVQRIENYDAARDTIFRVGFKSVFNSNSYQFSPKKGKIIRHIINLENFFVLNPNNTFNERSAELGYELLFKNTSGFEVGFSNNEAQLLFPAAFTDGVPLPAGRYKYNLYGLGYSTDTRKHFSFEAGFKAGSYFSGSLQQVSGSITYRSQPWLTVELNAEYNNLEFGGVYGKEDLFLIAPRVEVNFSTSLFWTTFIQYNTQANNFNINSRLQWRYKPASDLYIVYTDNYFSDPLFKSKNRSLVFKLNYWLNL